MTINRLSDNSSERSLFSVARSEVVKAICHLLDSVNCFDKLIIATPLRRKTNCFRHQENKKAGSCSNSPEGDIAMTGLNSLTPVIFMTE
jgi:hypothetical protein